LPGVNIGNNCIVGVGAVVISDFVHNSVIVGGPAKIIKINKEVYMYDHILVTRSSMPKIEEYTEEIKELWESHCLTNMGVKHKKLEGKLIDYLDVPEIVLFTNGHLALESAIAAYNLKGEAITTPFTFASTTHAIVRSGLEPVFCDINSDNYTIDTDKLENLITDKTSAIIPVHVYGNICNVKEIERIAKKHNLKEQNGRSMLYWEFEKYS